MSDWVITSKAYKPIVRREGDSLKTLQELYGDVLAMDCPSDKGTTHAYVDSYAKLFDPYRHNPINFLEIGVDFGYSLTLWRKYFENANIYGIDNRNVLLWDQDVTVVFGDANDPLTVARYFSAIDFDVILDDASHEIDTQITRFGVYYPKLKAGGIYVIEDIQSIDTEGPALKALHPSAEIIDLRSIKNRYDDVLMVYRK